MQLDLQCADQISAGIEHDLGGLDFSTTYYAAVKALDEFGNAGDVSNSPSGCNNRVCRNSLRLIPDHTSIKRPRTSVDTL